MCALNSPLFKLFLKLHYCTPSFTSLVLHYYQFGVLFYSFINQLFENINFGNGLIDLVEYQIPSKGELLTNWQARSVFERPNTECCMAVSKGESSLSLLKDKVKITLGP